MKILFFGTPKFAEIILQKLLESRHEVVGVVCQSDKPAGRGNRLQSPHIVEFAKSQGIEVFQFEKLSEHIEDFKKIECDLGVTASYGKFLPKSLLDILPIVNVHPSLLPKYRGATPIQSSLLNGDEVTGVSILKTVLEMDSGDLYAQKELKILPEDDYFSLHDKLANLGAEILLETLDKIENGSVNLTAQDDLKATYVKLIKKEDALLDFSMNVESLVNKVRAFCENPVAYFFVDGVRIKVYKAKVADMCTQARVGEILSCKKRFLIQAGDGVFEILRCQSAGGKVLDSASFLNGFHFKSMAVDEISTVVE